MSKEKGFEPITCKGLGDEVEEQIRDAIKNLPVHFLIAYLVVRDRLDDSIEAEIELSGDDERAVMKVAKPDIIYPRNLVDVAEWEGGGYRIIQASLHGSMTIVVKKAPESLRSDDLGQG